MTLLLSYIVAKVRPSFRYTLLSDSKGRSRRHLRLFWFSLASLVLLLIFVLLPPQHRRHDLFQYNYPYADLAKFVPPETSSFILPQFPDSPRQTALQPDDKNGHPVPWLVAIISGAFEAQQRKLIRSTWLRLYRDVPFHGRFVVSNPGSQWVDAIRLENQTYGDMIVLDHIHEDGLTANSIKTMELLKWLRKMGHRYEFVTKTDTDSFVNARVFYDKYLRPRLSQDQMSATVHETVIGQLLYNRPLDLTYPQGSFYTYTWDVVETLTDLYDEKKIIGPEDMIVGALLISGHVTLNMVNLRGSEQFDFNADVSRGNGSPWERNGEYAHAEQHALGQDAMVVHRLKTGELYQRVADCFTKDGIIEKPPSTGKEPGPPISYYMTVVKTWLGTSNWFQSRFEFIPKYYFRLEGNNWVCDGIWRLGSSRTGEQ